MFVEMLDERVDNFVLDQRLAGTIWCGLVPVHRKDAAQFVVGMSHCAHRLGQHLADAGRCGFHVAPAGAVRYLESMFAALAEDRLLLLGETAYLLPFQIGDCVVGLALSLIAEAFEEHQRQDVVLVVLPGGLTPEDVRGAPKVGFELLEREFHCARINIRGLQRTRS